MPAKAVLTSLIAIFLALITTGCATISGRLDPQAQADGTLIIDDWRSRRTEMEHRFPPGATKTAQEREAAARELVAAHMALRAGLRRPYPTETTQELDVRWLADLPLRRDQALRQKDPRTHEQTLIAEVAVFDHRQVTASDVSRIAAGRLSPEQQQLRGNERRVAQTEAETEVRRFIEMRRRTRAQEASSRRETDLARLARSGLADMPREIRQAAETNVTDARSPFDTQVNWRPAATAVRDEEVRLRSAVMQRMDEEARQAALSAASASYAARREAVAQQCRVQAAFIGSGVPSPYMGRGLGGAIASGLVGAIRQAGAEAEALDACLRASGI